jgi:urease accessory protein
MSAPATARTTATPMPSPRLVSLLHFADSAFPAGGYAHSLGLETYCAAGLVTDRTGLEAFLRSHLEGSAGPCDATAAVGAQRAAARGDMAACAELDRTLEAMKPVRELREASRQLGRQTLRVGAALTEDDRLRGYLADLEAGRVPGHHGVAFGTVAGALGWDAEDAAAALLYSTSALLAGAALRLMRMGQLEGQRVLWSLGPLIERLAAEAARRDAADLWSFAPGIEIQSIRHAALPARLFRS